MDIDTKTIDQYLENVSEPQKAIIEHVRELVKKEVPESVEGISYGMPAFKYKAKPLLYVGAFKDHMSIFPTAAPIGKLKEKLKDFTVGKGTIQFTLEKPLPDALIKEILQMRVAAISAD